jgi:hypothetical protein
MHALLSLSVLALSAMRVVAFGSVDSLEERSLMAFGATPLSTDDDPVVYDFDDLEAPSSQEADAFETAVS